AVAERLSARKTRRSICFAATTLEEYGMDGGLRLAERARRSGVAAVIDLEMIAFTGRGQAIPRGIKARKRGDFLAIVANERSAFIGRALVERARRMEHDLNLELVVLRGDGNDLPISRLSGHARCWDSGLTAVIV